VSEEDLQRAIDVSLATASPLARRIYANERWSAARVQRFVNRVMGATVATSGWRQAARRGGACSMSGRNGVLLRGLPRLAAASATWSDMRPSRWPLPIAITTSPSKATLNA